MSALVVCRQSTGAAASFCKQLPCEAYSFYKQLSGEGASFCKQLSCEAASSCKQTSCHAAAKAGTQAAAGPHESAAPGIPRGVSTPYLPPARRELLSKYRTLQNAAVQALCSTDFVWWIISFSHLEVTIHYLILRLLGEQRDPLRTKHGSSIEAKLMSYMHTWSKTYSGFSMHCRAYISRQLLPTVMGLDGI